MIISIARAAAGIAVALSLSLSAAPARGEPADPFAGAATGTLWLDLELSGTGRMELPNGVEWASLKAQRKMSVKLRMLDMGNRNVPIVAGKGRPGATAPAGMEAIEKAAAACKGDQACLVATMMKYGSQLKPEAYGLKLDSKRFRNWAGDRRGGCASGTLSVRDRGEGVIISPPAPAAAHRFERAGSVDAGQTARLSEALCAAELTYDAEAATASLRLQFGGLNVPVTLTGHAFTHEKSVRLVEGRNTLELFDQPVPPGAEAGGSVELPEFGSASHNSGQVAAPLGGTLSWRFLPD